MERVIKPVLTAVLMLVSGLLDIDRWIGERLNLKNAILYTLSAVGVAALGMGAYFWVQVSALDGKAVGTYWDLMQKVIETGDPAEATVWKAKVADGLTFKEVDESIKNIANENNIKNVGELPLYSQIEAMTGKPYRKVKIYMYCNALTAMKMLEHSDAYSAYLPCRVTLLEDKTGQLWIYTLNMDMMIHGGKPLPEALKKEALEVKRIIKDVLKRGAAGDF